ncbi:MAG: hypothetical protein V4710_04640 [Verrucomicrobiota bacterium]
MSIKRLLLILAAAVLAVIVAAAAVLTPKLRNMGSEYETAQAIEELKEYVERHAGRWPGSSNDLGGRYPVGGRVHLDYSMTSARLIENPALLRDSVRPRSGRFYTFPHYDKMIGGLHAVLRETNQQSAPSGGDKPSN